MVAPRTSFCSFVAVVLTACATGPSLPTLTIDPAAAVVPAPPAVVAAIAGGALRLSLPDSDPVPAAPGIVVEPRPDGGFRLAFARLGDRWLGLGSHRLTIALAVDPTQPVVTTMPSRRHEGANPAATAAAAFAIDILPAPGGAHVHGTVPAAAAPALQAALALLADPRAALPGLQEPNLAVWASHRLQLAAREADRAGDATAAHALRTTASRLAPVSGDVHAMLALDAQCRGDVDAAEDHGWQAMLATSDATQRAALAARLHELRERRDDARAWRRAARDHQEDLDPRTASALLHTARRLEPMPSLDYRLQSELHHRHADLDLASATALLAREHAGIVTDLPTFLAEVTTGDAAPQPALARHAAPPR